MAIRLALLSHHYQSDHMWTEKDLDTATKSLTNLRIALSREEVAPTDEVVQAIISALSNNLDTGQAISHIQDWVQRTLSADYSPEENKGTPGELSRAIDALLGIAI
jgi:L-cysteine:1D-myo-inositol 2-amino-2-deoxy-alpha-D-glucopyranoside ligase